MLKPQYSRINDVFSNAWNQGRNTLYEHEVYEILDSIGVDVPHCVFVENTDEVTDKLLSSFASPFLMVKTVSRDMAHNQKYGGVKKVSGKDPLFVQFVMDKMRNEVLSHFSDNEKPRIDGFLIVEFVKFTQSLGNELMIGQKEDAAFGAVTTLTKGGDDAEFFAKYYDPANLLLSPVTYEDAYELSKNIKIRHKYEQTGHIDYLEKIARTLSAISYLGHDYSFMSDKSPKFHLKVLDVNPLVFSEDGKFIAIDGYAEFEAAKEKENFAVFPNTNNLEGFFNPDGVAIFGVTSDPSKYSLAKVITNLFTDLGRKDIYCVNPKGGEAVIDGTLYPLYKGFHELPENVDLIVYSAPAKNTLKFLETVPANKSVILISGIPPELDYADFIRRTKERKPGIRLIGPNCMGVFNAPNKSNPGVNTLFIDESRLKISYNEKSNTALFTQSGAMGITMIERTVHSKILRTIVSFGNKSDVNIPDLMAYFENEKNIDVMSLYMEGINEYEGRQFFELACSSKKPIIVYKSGRTEAGAKAAASHTASMSGSYEIFKAACEQSGCVLTEDLDNFYNFTKAFAMLHNKEVSGNKVAGVVNAGLDATMSADTIYYLEQTKLAPETVEKISKLNTHGLVDINTSFLDVTPMTDDRLFAKFVEAVINDENVDCMFIAIVPHIDNLKTMENDYLDSDAIAVLLTGIAHKTKKPIVISVNAGNHYQHLVAYFEEHGIPVYPNIHAAIKSLDAFVTHR